MTPLEMAADLEQRYQRYLHTTFYFRDPLLRASFERALASGRLTKGPYLEATPPFRFGQAPRQLFKELLGFEPEEAFLRAILGDRPLYVHQQEAIRHASNGHNVAVATGTSSGKTEAFLLPILLRLYSTLATGIREPGVRALILYPMNALANDQRERLGEICTRLADLGSSFRFTFGEYTGETPEDQRDTHRGAADRLANRLPSELVLRSEMRAAPPDILLSNYSMLEYLLLRPQDSPLFDDGAGRTWEFLILDEIHQYRGARGGEIAMLIRRLKRRLRDGGSARAPICLATSATLAGGPSDKRAVADFCAELFSEPFSEDKVLLPSVYDLGPAPTEDFAVASYDLLGNMIESGSANVKLEQLAAQLGVSVPPGMPPHEAAGLLLRHDGRAHLLRALVTSSAMECSELAARLFEPLAEPECSQAFSRLVELLLRARDPDTNLPLLVARYHLFMRALEGAFLSYLPHPTILLDRSAPQVAQFEIALCRECGQHYLVGQKGVAHGHLVEPVRDPSHRDFGASFFRPLDSREDPEDAEIDPGRLFVLCVECGEIARHSPPCGHHNLIRVVRQDSSEAEDRADQMIRCDACGYSAGGKDPVREILIGADGPNAVIATGLYLDLPAGRKKILAFADGRQEAAFFAWYLDDTTREIVSRSLIYDVVRSLGPHTAEGLTLREVASELKGLLRERRILPPSAGEIEALRDGWSMAYREFLTEETRVSLEGVGLASWSPKLPPDMAVPPVLKSEPWGMTEAEAWDLLRILLDSVRVDKAVELRLPQGVNVRWSDLGLQAAQTSIRIGAPHGQRNIRSWDGAGGRRTRFLVRLLEVRGITGRLAEGVATSTLREVWEHLCAHSQLERDSLITQSRAGWQLNPDWWRVSVVREAQDVYSCNICSRLSWVSVNLVCPRPRCNGTLQPSSVHAVDNHYRVLYEQGFPAAMTVEEHTAQLDHAKARDFQHRFKAGQISMLSCSTTFELGVDLGDLDAIFLRNVPPEAFNYKQRVGRAGRRMDSAGFAVTYCRRGPHDLYHFADPLTILKGNVRPPTLSTDNEKIVLRHLVATTLSDFFRRFPDRFGSVGDFFHDLNDPTATADLMSYIGSRAPVLEDLLRDITPSTLLGSLGLQDGRWRELLAGTDSRLSLAQAEVASDFGNVQRFETAAVSESRYVDAEWAKQRRRTIASEDTLTFLSRKAVIPKYGFPVDLVELDTHRNVNDRSTTDVQLQRDLGIAISEFAPTSGIVANKKLWTSYGLKKVTEREWPRKLYKRCHEHNVFIRWDVTAPEPPTPCEHDLPAYQYVVPSFGFQTKRERPPSPTARPARVFTTRPYFGGREGDPGRIQTIAGRNTVTLTKASPGTMVVLSEGRHGQGFHVCSQCGAGFRRPQGSHQNAYGTSCQGTLERVALGHEFVTDVVQIQIDGPLQAGPDPSWFALSLAYALVEGAADTLGVPRNDLSATIGHSTGATALAPILIYDAVPGGAGLVARLENTDVLRACLEAARSRVAGACGCGEDASCYGCLRNYNNQFAHQHLRRGPVLRLLDTLISEWPIGPS